MGSYQWTLLSLCGLGALTFTRQLSENSFLTGWLADNVCGSNESTRKFELKKTRNEDVDSGSRNCSSSSSGSLRWYGLRPNQERRFETGV